jgi:glycosyltransferase involved in cell wall biosynthesis
MRTEAEQTTLRGNPRLLILTFYYPPDLSAGSFRVAALVDALRARAQGRVDIDVITTLPNRYQTFTQEAPQEEVHEGLRIRRIRLPQHRSDMLHQSRAFLSYARQVRREVAHRDYGLVFATSSRLMTAALGASIAARKRLPLYLDIRDIFVDTIQDVLPRPLAWPVGRCCALLESFTMRRASRINLVSRGFESYFRERGYDKSLAWFTNGIDDEFLAIRPQRASGRPAGAPTTVLYAGNIGEGQSLHRVVPDLALALGDKARFVLIGDGGRRAALDRALAERGVRNVELQPPMPRAQLLQAYLEADVLFLHLGDHDAFRKVLPSKIFEYAALGKPILAGVAGYAARFLRDEVVNAAVFGPGDVAGALRAFESLELLDRPRPAFIEKFARAKIARAMADDILALLAPPARSVQ